MRRTLPWQCVVVLLAAASLTLAAGCGGDDGGDEDPQTLLDKVASKPIESADVDLRTDADVPGFPILGSRLVMTGSGPFVARGADSLPELDWRVMLRAGGQSFPARLTAVDGRAFVEFMGQIYEADPDLLDRFGVGEDGRRAGTSLKQLGLDPSTWLTRVKVSDGDDVGGDSTRVVTGAVDKRAVLEDLLSVIDAEQLEEAGDDVEGLPELNDENLDKAAAAIDRVKVEVNVDDDGYPRRVYARLHFNMPKEVEDTAIEEGTVTVELQLDDIDEATVDVVAPEDPDNLDELLDFAAVIFGVDEVSDLWRTPN
jgi:hypothetical protein